MKDKFKKIILKMYIFRYLKAVKNIYIKNRKQSDNKQSLLNILFNTKVYTIDKNYSNINKLIQKINYSKQKRNKKFFYYIDNTKVIMSKNQILYNLTVDYSKILEKSLNDYILKIVDDYSIRNNNLIESLKINIDNCISAVSKFNNTKLEMYFRNIKDKSANSFEEALQRILWLNQLLWQTGHGLMGLGRLDKILNPYYVNDIKNNVITKEYAKELIKEFVCILHENYCFKSAQLIGDTGQIIVLGGLNKDGTYFYNDLTYMFINVIKELQFPEPKTLLRVSENMPDDLIQTALASIKTGIGCPLFSNDDIVISKLINIGIDEDDAYEYVTSACWEPLIAGKSVAQNNVSTITFLKPFNEMLENTELDNFNNIEDIIVEYEKYLEKYMENKIQNFESIIYNEDALISMFTENCAKTKKDVTKGGAKYNNIGLTSVSMANLVNSLINIDELVFKKNKYKLSELEKIRKNNFIKEKQVQIILKNNKCKFGNYDEAIINLTNKLSTIADKIISRYNTKYGGKYKFGLSAPSYIDEAKDCTASLDGRENYEPFSVHISSESGDFFELMQFATKLNYSGNRINGNVIDFIISPTMLEDNLEKFKLFIITSIKIGFYQMQINVVSSEILIKAKEKPELFPNLIVRVWGFSAYFNDLPEEYKLLIIERTLKSENKIVNEV